MSAEIRFPSKSKSLTVSDLENQDCFSFVGSTIPGHSGIWQKRYANSRPCLIRLDDMEWEDIEQAENSPVELVPKGTVVILTFEEEGKL